MTTPNIGLYRSAERDVGQRSAQDPVKTPVPSTGMGRRRHAHAGRPTTGRRVSFAGYRGGRKPHQGLHICVVVSAWEKGWAASVKKDWMR